MDLLIHDLAAACERDAAHAYAMPAGRVSYRRRAFDDDANERELGAPGVGSVRLGTVSPAREAAPDRAPVPVPRPPRR